MMRGGAASRIFKYISSQPALTKYTSSQPALRTLHTFPSVNCTKNVNNVGGLLSGSRAPFLGVNLHILQQTAG